MTLPSISLDDLTYEDLRKMAVRRLPAASGGRWTHHAPVDAGITLLELFAFLLEQQLFVLDQVPDSLIHAMLVLLGESPRPAGVARTVLAAETGSLTEFVELPARTTLRPESAALATLVFSTDAATLLPPVVQLETAADGVPISGLLARGTGARVFSAFGRAGRIDVDVTLAQPFTAAHTGAELAFAVLLDGTAVAPEWSPDATSVPPPIALDLGWLVPGSSALLTRWRDGTGGLRRSGLIRFDVPAAFVGQDRFRLTLSTTAATLAEPPRLAAHYLGAVIAQHRQPFVIGPADTGEVDHDALRSELLERIAMQLPISGQTLRLPEPLSPCIADSIALRLAGADGTFHDWAPVADLTTAPPEARVFTFDRGRGEISFGDGYTGRVPGPATDVSLALQRGGGTEGNHPPGLVWKPVKTAPPDPRLVSVAEGVGGAEPETLDEARARVAGTLARRHRAVTADDYRTLIETAPGLGPHRAHVMPTLDPNFRCIAVADSLTVYVVPRTGRDVTAPRADDGALARFRSILDEARMMTTRVFVARPRFRPVALSLTIDSYGKGARDFTHLLRPLLSDYLHPSIGGPERTGWPFGRPLRPSEIMRVAAAETGTGTRVSRAGIALTDTTAAEEDCTEVTIGPADLVYLAQLRVTVVAGRSAEATL